LFVVITCNSVNIGLNFLFVYGLGMGIAGSAVGSLIAQTASAALLATVVVRGARRLGAPLALHPLGVLAAARSGIWLLVRTATLQVALTATTAVAAGLGAVGLATHQIAYSLWNLLVFALDAIAIAAQAMIGRFLGAGATDQVRSLTNRLIGWGLVAGAVFGTLVATSRPLYEDLFSTDRAVQGLLANVVWVVALMTPIAGVVFVLDGVLIGAGDGRYLALAGLIAMVSYVPLALLVRHGGLSLVWLWASYGGFIFVRFLTLVVRAGSSAWMRIGSPAGPAP